MHIGARDRSKSGFNGGNLFRNTRTTLRRRSVGALHAKRATPVAYPRPRLQNPEKFLCDFWERLQNAS
ncbi:hypothetical protein PUN28_014658 [Cardiocondyla obscurior]|uniref:Uncharacterized protein n=1 Tax=Cardiocondyla obscurior TaxID=286306 RepID=A0AAW2EUR2_9HYME